jgi:hypothetical protein
LNSSSLEHQTAIALTALSAALVKQPGINGDSLRLDFLEIIEGIARSPAEVGTVGIQIASLMDTILRADPRKP